MTNAPKSLTIIVPCYNEQELLENTALSLIALIEQLIKLNKISSLSNLLFVDDGSIDSTWSIISKLSLNHKVVQGLKLTRNFGHQNALIAGLYSFKNDFCISIDADLQDDIKAIPKMIDDYYSGSHIVYGQRSKRNTDTLFKRNTAKAYYKMLSLLGVEILEDHADFRLMSREAVEKFKLFGESNMFIRGIIPKIGFQSSIVTYERQARCAGETKYSLRKMLRLALDGIISFTSFPLYIISFLGLTISFGTIILGLWALFIKIFSNSVVPGWASTVIPIYFIGGIQLFSIGILGIYISKVFEETKKRPRFIIEEHTGSFQNE